MIEDTLTPMQDDVFLLEPAKVPQAYPRNSENSSTGSTADTFKAAKIASKRVRSWSTGVNVVDISERTSAETSTPRSMRQRRRHDYKKLHTKGFNC